MRAGEKLISARRDLEDKFCGDAASRAYYAAFHAITAVLAARGLTFSSHAQALGAFNREFVRTGIFPPDTTRRLQQLFEDRQVGDYDWSRTLEEATAVQDLESAEQVVAACRAHLQL